jgi:hypothetical protein
MILADSLGEISTKRNTPQRVAVIQGVARMETGGNKPERRRTDGEETKV